MNIEVSVCDSRALPVRFCRTPVFTRPLFKQWTLVSFFFHSPFLSLCPAFVLVREHYASSSCAHHRWKGRGERGWAKRERESKIGWKRVGRHNKYNGWASSWRESPGDFAGFCNWNASGGEQGTRRINATLLLLRGLPLFRDSAQPSRAKRRQLNGMSKAILVPFLVPLSLLYVSSVSFLSNSPLVLFFFILVLFHLRCLFVSLSISIHSRSRWISLARSFLG